MLIIVVEIMVSFTKVSFTKVSFEKTLAEIVSVKKKLT